MQHPDRLSAYTYVTRPTGYHWRKQTSPDGQIVYYGVDPKTHWTVYVGPDGTYYTFPHAPPITPSDLGSLWDPHDAH